MTPYLRQQLLYVVLSAAVAWGIDHWLGRVAAFEGRPWRRLFASYAALATPLVLWIVAVRRFDHPHSTFQFISVAIGFYAGAFFLPLANLWRARRESSSIGGRALAAACVVALAVGADALLVEPDRIVTAEHELSFESWPASSPPLRVVHVSDLQTVGECEREHEAARRINELEPDLIVVTGDYAAGPFKDPEPAIAAARAFFAALKRPRLGIVVVPGHAEPESIRERIFADFDLIYLANDGVELAVDGPGAVDGRTLRVFGSRTLEMGFDLARFVPRRGPGLVTVFASHEPDVCWNLLDIGVDLHLCGHTHGGQIVLPFFGPPMTLSQLPNRYARGLHEFGDHWMNVNPGLGMEGNHAPRIRFLCPPQIDLLVLRGGGAPRKYAATPSRE